MVSNTCRRPNIRLYKLSTPAKTPPGRSTRRISRSKRSCNAAEGTWCNIVKLSAASNRPFSNDISVASSRTTVTFLPAVRRLRESAKRRSISTHVKDVTRARSMSVEIPGPGPISRMFGPRSIPSRTYGSVWSSIVCLQREDAQTHRCRTFITTRLKLLSEPTGVAGSATPGILLPNRLTLPVDSPC